VQIISLELNGNDFLAAYDGSQVDSSNLIMEASNQANCPTSFVSSSANVTVRYVGNPSKSQFLLSYSLPVTSASMLSTSNSWQNLTSPNYPDLYDSNYDYIWTLYAPIRNVIEIRFGFFQTLENLDFVTIYDGDSTFQPPYVQYSGESNWNSSHIFISTGNYLTIRFTTSRNAYMSGFLIDYASYKSGENMTTEPPPITTTTAITPDAYCSGNGNYTCHCFYGYTGRDCENEVNFCAELIDDYKGGQITAGQLCAPHGACMSSPQGASCNCNQGFTGQFCEDEIPNETAIAVRCALYQTNYTVSNQVPIGCPTQQQICIPDHIRCAVGNSCARPLGWCIPASTYATSNYITELITLLNGELLF